MNDMILTEANLTTINTSLEIIQDMARISKINKLDEDDTNSFVTLDDMIFHNGVIEVDVCGKLRDDAPSYARGFIGIVFRVNEMNNEFESFYIRPANGKNCTDPIRKQHACQYFSYPGYTYSYFREYGIQDFESELNTIALNKWSHIKAVIQDETALFYVDDKLALTVNQLKHGDSQGKIGFYVDIGTDGWFKNLKVKLDEFQ